MLENVFFTFYNDQKSDFNFDFWWKFTRIKPVETHKCFPHPRLPLPAAKAANSNVKDMNNLANIYCQKWM